MFGRATITLGIGPHSSTLFFREYAIMVLCCKTYSMYTRHKLFIVSYRLSYDMHSLLYRTTTNVI